MYLAEKSQSIGGTDAYRVGASVLHATSLHVSKNDCMSFLAGTDDVLRIKAHAIGVSSKFQLVCFASPLASWV